MVIVMEQEKDCGGMVIVMEQEKVLQAPVANHAVVYLSNLFKNCVGYAMLRLNRDQESLMPRVSWLLALFHWHVVVAQP